MQPAESAIRRATPPPFKAEAPARRCLWAAFIAITLVLTWQTLAVRYHYDGNWTALFCTGELLPVPPALRDGTYLWKGSYGYDGQFYRYIAHDPLFRKGYSEFVDDPRLRYRRLLVPGLAHLLAGTREGWIDAAYLGVVAVFLAAGVYWSARYAQLMGRPAWLGLLFLLGPGALVSIDRMLVDGAFAALFMGFVVYATTQSWRKLLLVSMLAFLSRETGLFFVVAAAAWFCLTRRYAHAAAFAIAASPALAWYGYVWQHTAPSSAHSILNFPGLGLVRRLLEPRHLANASTQPFIQALDAAAVIGLAAGLAITVVWIKRDRLGPVQICLGLFVLLGMLLGSASHMTEPYGFARPVAPLLTYVLLRSAGTGAHVLLLPPLAVAASIGVVFVSPLWHVLRGLLAALLGQ